MTGVRLDHEIRSDRGETTVQIVLVLPVVLMVLLAAVQTSVFFHTSNVAGAAASQAASAAVADGDTTGVLVDRARTAAFSLLEETGTRLTSPIEVDISAEYVFVAVEAHVPRIAPFFPAKVRRTASEPRERFLTEAMR